jgi:hypothetical protein
VTTSRFMWVVAAEQDRQRPLVLEKLELEEEETEGTPHSRQAEAAGIGVLAISLLLSPPLYCFLRPPLQSAAP